MLIKRNGKSLTQRGSTVIQAGDTLLIPAENFEPLEKVKGKIGI
jgi:Trk K+ transport system NAD-binding subunit